MAGKKRTAKSAANVNEASPKMSKPGCSHSDDDPSVDWRSSNKTLNEGFKYLFRNERYSDVDIFVGEGKQKERIPAHKLVLCLRSIVFATMLSKDWSKDERVKEEPRDEIGEGKSEDEVSMEPRKDEVSEKGSKTEITVKGVKPAPFLALLKFLYYDYAEFEEDTVMFVLHAAQFYQVNPLLDRCVEFLVKNLDSGNAFDLLPQALFFKVPTLISACLEFLDDNIEAAIESPGFLKIDLESLCLVLKRDSLKIDEIELFKATVRWSKAECKRQKLAIKPKNQLSVLKKETLDLIRFTCMSLDEFSCQEVAESGLLSPEDVASVMLYLVRVDKPKTRFNQTPRASPDFVLDRFPKVVAQGWPCNGNSERIRFTVDQNIRLKGLSFFGSMNGPAYYDVSFSLKIVNSYSIILHRPLQKLYHDGREDTFTISFKTPFQLYASKFYEIDFTIKGPPSFSGSCGSSIVYFEQAHAHGQTVKITFSDVYSDEWHTTNIENGQLASLVFTF